MRDLNIYFLIFSGTIACLLYFYFAFRVQRYRGIALLSKTESVYSLIFYFIQLAIPAYVLFEDHFTYVLIIIILITMIIKTLKIYANGRVIVIYDTSKDILVE